MVRVFTGIEDFRGAVGQELGTSDWLVIDQNRINAFAEATGDYQWIHVDVERAKDGPFGATLAHGYLTLSLAPVLAEQVYRVDGVEFGVNYGIDRARFPSPVPVGSRIRLAASLVSAVTITMGTKFTLEFVITTDSSEKPACVMQVSYAMA